MKSKLFSFLTILVIFIFSTNSYAELQRSAESIKKTVLKVENAHGDIFKFVEQAIKSKTNKSYETKIKNSIRRFPIKAKLSNSAAK